MSAPFIAPHYFLGNAISPGTIEAISGHDAPDNWDVQAPKGSTGAATKLNGRGVRRPQITIYLAGGYDGEPDDFADWQAHARLLDSLTSGPTPRALPIYHPDLAASKITEVTRANVSGLVYDGTGGARVTVEFIEYKPPRPKPAKKPAAQGGSVRVGVTTTRAPDPNADKRAELTALLAVAGDSGA